MYQIGKCQWNDLDIKLGLLNQPWIMVDGLFDFVQHLPNPAHVKNIQTGKYLLSNKNNARIYAIENEADLVGLTVRDIEGNDYVDVVNELDAQVRTQKIQLIDERRVVVNRNGILRLQTMHKIPIRGFTHKQPQCILTLCHDFINYLTSAELFSLYLKAYPQKPLSILLYLKHIKVDHYFKSHDFYDAPSHKQILILLKIAELSDYGRVAQALNMTRKAIDYHISNLKEKIHCGGINQLIVDLRNRNWASIPSI